MRDAVMLVRRAGQRHALRSMAGPDRGVALAARPVVLRMVVAAGLAVAVPGVTRYCGRAGGVVAMMAMATRRRRRRPGPGVVRGGDVHPEKAGVQERRGAEQ